MKKTWYAALAITGTLLVAGALIGVANASVLERARTGEHGSFTRVVFEFKGGPENAAVDSVGEGRLSLLFPNTWTDLPPVLKFPGRKRVDRIEFVRNGSDLTADVVLKLPYFSLKTLRLKDPERVVFDLHWIPMTTKTLYSPMGSKEDGKGNDLSGKSLSISVKGAATRSAVGLASNEVSGITQEAGESTWDEVQDSKKGLLISFVRYGFWQAVFLGMLNLFTLIVIIMLGFALSRQIRRVDGQDQQEKDKEAQKVKKEDRRLMLIDAGIKKRLRKRYPGKAA